MRLAVEKDLETVRKVALLLEAENHKLVAKNVELTRELLKLKGLGAEQLQLKLQELQQQLAARNKALFGKASEKRGKGSRGAAKDTPQTGHGPKDQPALRGIDKTVELDSAAASTTCPHCEKPVVEWPGQFEESEEIDVISREFVVKTIKRKKARCECCRTIVTAPAPLKLFAGARYSIAFAVLVVVSKYADHLPLERQVKMMKRDGLDVDSQTLWDYVWALAQLLKPAHERLLEYVISCPVIGADETWWRLMGGKPKGDGGDGEKWWMWSVCTSNAACYRVEDSRSAKAGAKLIGDYQGTVMCDGYSVYTSLADSGVQFRLAHCWSHVRRNLWKGLLVFLDDPRVPLHNNASERSLRGPVIGRVNHFGSRSKRGTEAAAILYSLVESAKLAGVDPNGYLEHAACCALRGEVIPLPHETAAPDAATPT